MSPIYDLLEFLPAEEEIELSDKPWKDGRKSKKRKNSRRFDSDEWEETQKARAAYLRDWEEDIRYAEELANEGM